MAPRNTSSNAFNRTTSEYWGFALISGIGMGAAYLFDSTIIAGIAGIIALAGIDGFFYSGTRKIHFQDGRIIIERGLGLNKTQLNLSQVDKITLAAERKQRGSDILNFDFDEAQDYTQFKHIQIFSKGKEKPSNTISYNNFTDEVFEALIKETQRYFLQHIGSPLIRASFVLAKTEKYLNKDKQLRKQLNETLSQAYASVYKPFKATLPQSSTDFLKADVLHQYAQQDNTLIYFKKGYYQEDTDPQSPAFQTAQNLIEATQENLSLVQSRITSHEEVKDKLNKVIHRISRQEQLDEVSDRLNKLQQANVQESLFREGMALEAEVVSQLYQLSQQVNQADDLERSQVLREHIRIVSGG